MTTRPQTAAGNRPRAAASHPANGSPDMCKFRESETRRARWREDRACSVQSGIRCPGSGIRYIAMVGIEVTRGPKDGPTGPGHRIPEFVSVSPLHIQINPDTLHLRVVLECVSAHLAAETALLVAAKWRRRIVHVVGIDPHCPSVKLACDVMRLLDVPSPHACGEAILRI